jgi:sirohydrochlorin ferrochelatase
MKTIPQDLFEGQKTKSNHMGIIILGHGSRLKKANGLIAGIIKTIKEELKLRNIHPAYLQLVHPNLSKGIRNLAKEGCRKIIIVPFFLFAGNHVSRDIPGIIREEKRKYPHIAFVYTKNLGQDLRIAEIVVDKIKEGINGSDKQSPKDRNQKF